MKVIIVSTDPYPHDSGTNKNIETNSNSMKDIYDSKEIISYLVPSCVKCNSHST